MRREEMSLDQCAREPGVYFNPDEGVIIKVSKVSPLMQHEENLAVGKKGGEHGTTCIKVSNDPYLSDDDVEAIIRERIL